jgi:hypothetical protein
LLNQGFRTLNIIISSDDPLILVDTILLDSIPETENSSVIPTSEHDNFAFPGEMSCPGQRMEIGLGSRVAKANLIEVKA